MARAFYETATCSALMGQFLFKDGPFLSREQSEVGPPLIVCLGDREWKDCPTGLPDAFRILEANFPGGRFGDLPDDWGVVADSTGEVLYRFNSLEIAMVVTYLGRDGGPLATVPVTVSEIGIDPLKGQPC